MRFTCPSCSKAYRLSRDRLGGNGQAKIRCPNCKSVVRVAAGEGDELVCTLAQSSAHPPSGGTGRSPALRSTGAQKGRAKKPAPQAKAPQTKGPTSSKRTNKAGTKSDPAVWHVAIGKQAKGPMSTTKVKQLRDEGKISASSLAWRKGQDGWKKIGEIAPLASLFVGPAHEAQASRAAPRRTLPATSQPKRGEVERAAKKRREATGSEAIKHTKRSPSASPVPKKSASVQNPSGEDNQATVMADVVNIAEPSGKLKRQAPRPHRDRDPTRKEPATQAAPEARSLRGTVPVASDQAHPVPSDQANPVPSDQANADLLDGQPTLEQPVVQSRETKRGRRGKQNKRKRRGKEEKARSEEKNAKSAAPVEKRKPASRAKAAAHPAPAPLPQPPPKRGADKRGKKNARGAQGSQDPRNHSSPKPPVPATPTTAPPTTKAPNNLDANQKNVQVAGQTASFFETGQSFMSDVDFALPDPNKHKPTKEEYNNLLQEFSVMFRLDKRTKRQKWGIIIVLLSLFLGVIGFGVTLVVQGEQRKNLIRDSKTILAVFSLPYQTSVTVRLGGDDEKKGAVVSTSRLAGELQKKIALRRKKIRKRVASAKKNNNGRVALQNAGRQGGFMPVKKTHLTRAQIRAQEKAAREAIARSLGAMGGRRERAIGVKTMTTDVTKKQLRDLCRSKRQDLYVCGQRFAKGAGYKAVLTINDAGTIDKVKALVDGNRDDALSRCAAGVFSRTKFGLQSKTRTHSCIVGG